MNKITTLIVMMAGVTFSSVHAQDSILKNGDFEEPDINNYQKGWFQHSDEPSSDEWVKIVDSSADGGRAVEIRSGPPQRYLFQDVKIKEGESGPHLLRWKAKGAGEASISALPRDAEGRFGKTFSKMFPLTQDFEPYEIPMTIPDDAVYVRITLAAREADSIVVFDDVELVPVSDSK